VSGIAVSVQLVSYLWVRAPACPVGQAPCALPCPANTPPKRVIQTFRSASLRATGGELSPANTSPKPVIQQPMQMQLCSTQESKPQVCDFAGGRGELSPRCGQMACKMSARELATLQELAGAAERFLADTRSTQRWPNIAVAASQVCAVIEGTMGLPDTLQTDRGRPLDRLRLETREQLSRSLVCFRRKLQQTRQSF